MISSVFLEFTTHTRALRCALPFPLTKRKKNEEEKNCYNGYSSTVPYVMFCNWNSTGQDCIWLRKSASPTELWSPFFQTKVKEQESFLLSLNRALRKGTIGENHFLVFCRGCPHYKSYCSLFKHLTLWWTITFSIRKIWTFFCCGEGKHNLPLQVRKDFSLRTPNYIDNDHIPQNILI